MRLTSELKQLFLFCTIGLVTLSCTHSSSESVVVYSGRSRALVAPSGASGGYGPNKTTNRAWHFTDHALIDATCVLYSTNI